MNRRYLIILLATVAFSVSSCVSKKKYVEMESGRLKAEELSRKLDAENKDKAARIKTLIADFEAMKNELMESNAMKDQYIDSLKGEISNMMANLNKQTRSLEETSFNLDFEKQRLSNALESKDKNIQSLQTTDRLYVYTPANWEKGDDYIVPYFPYTKAEAAADPEINDQYYQVSDRIWFKKAQGQEVVENNNK